ncbi:unnamed protein product [Oncorhynchus mykiss]|uniref:DH domain-containing protein n=1 Tax=Oncorhynchus mykiss TaxID=8022 RepID=A0A060XUQ1_ONCMY|nr:unnamed protein product [Oncorhynchus mykiss]
MAAGGGCGDTVEQCRAEVERLTRELAEANREKVRAAECGLVVLEENQTLKQQYSDLEAEQEALRQELEQLQEAFGQTFSTQRKVAADGETNEETLLQESATKEAYYMSRLLGIQSELKQSRAVTVNTQADNEHLSTLLQELRESNEMLELQRSRMREEIREYKFREARLLQDYTELEEENITLQKLVSTLKQNQAREHTHSTYTRMRLHTHTHTHTHTLQLEDALRLKDISEAQLEEALDSLKSEREQKKHLRKELVHHLSLCDVQYTGSAHLTFTSAPPKEPGRCNGHLHGGANGECRGAGRKGEGMVSDLFSEMNLTEIQKLKQQLLQVEREKTALLISLQECQTQLQHTQGALNEQHERAQRLSERETHLNREALMELGEEEEEEKEKGLIHSRGQAFCHQTPGLEILQCKYRVAVTEVVELKAELKSLRERYNQCVEGGVEERTRGEAQHRSLEQQVGRLERSCREGREKVGGLETELRTAKNMASESQGALNAAQDELVTFSEELAQLYHHVCLCNNETPNRVMLDYYRHGRGLRGISASLKGDDTRVLLTPRLARRLAAVAAATSSSTAESRRDGGRDRDSPVPRTPPTGSPSISASSSSSSSSSPAVEPAGDLRREPMNIYNLNAIIREQVRHLQRAVDRSLQLSRQRAAARELAPLFDKDKEACMEEILKLKSLLSTKREQIATLRLVLKANKQTAENALANLKSKYENEKHMVTDTMMKLRNELKALKEDAATFSSLRAMFATRCDEYVTQLDEMQRQLAAAEDEKKTLNSLLRMAIQQKLALTQRLEDLAFDQEQSHCTRRGKVARMKRSTPKVSPGPPSSPTTGTGAPLSLTSATTDATALALSSPTTHHRHPFSPSSTAPSGPTITGSPPSLEAPSSSWTPPSTPHRLAHSQWALGVRTGLAVHSPGKCPGTRPSHRPVKGVPPGTQGPRKGLGIHSPGKSSIQGGLGSQSPGKGAGSRLNQLRSPGARIKRYRLMAGSPCSLPDLIHLEENQSVLRSANSSPTHTTTSISLDQPRDPGSGPTDSSHTGLNAHSPDRAEVVACREGRAREISPINMYGLDLMWDAVLVNGHVGDGWKMDTGLNVELSPSHRAATGTEEAMLQERPTEEKMKRGSEEVRLQDSTEQKLYKIANKLLLTERAYVARLHLLDQVFCARLTEEAGKGLFPLDVVRTIFSNISSIHTFHSQFLLPDLETHMGQWSVSPRLGDVMQQHAPFLRMYAEYVMSFDHAMELLRVWTERSAPFRNVIQDIQSREVCCSLTLQHHIL